MVECCAALHLILVRKIVQTVSKITNVTKKVRHVLVEVQWEHRGFEHGLVHDLFWLEVQFWPSVWILHELIGQLLSGAGFWVDSLVVKKLTQSVEELELLVFSMALGSSFIVLWLFRDLAWSRSLWMWQLQLLAWRTDSLVTFASSLEL